MPYISSSGEEKDVTTMPDSYLKNALAKAEREGNQDNMDALNAEIERRGLETSNQ